MRLHRFLCDVDFVGRSFIELKDAELVQQIKNVLRLREGDRLIVVDGKNHEATAEIFAFVKGAVKLKILEVHESANENSHETVLYCAVLKKENFELVAQKATEIGVKEIIPIITERTVKLNVKIDRLEKIIKEAVEQSGRGEVPILRPVMTLKQVVAHAKQNNLNLFCDASGERLSVQVFNKTNRIGVFVGPEGGWADGELSLARQNNFKIISLGSTTLRAETAAIVATYLVVNKLLR